MCAHMCFCLRVHIHTYFNRCIYNVILHFKTSARFSCGSALFAHRKSIKRLSFGQQYLIALRWSTAATWPRPYPRATNDQIGCWEMFWLAGVISRIICGDLSTRTTVRAIVTSAVAHINSRWWWWSNTFCVVYFPSPGRRANVSYIFRYHLDLQMSIDNSTCEKLRSSKPSTLRMFTHKF